MALRLFSWDAQILNAARTHPDDFTAPLNALRESADRALDVEPRSVTDKQTVPPSGDRHDYMSLGSYWWPNPDTADGLPYVRRDGEYNPEGDALDTRPLRAICGASETLALASHMFDDDACNRHAALLLRTWFLDPKTRMNPHLEYAQSIPGVCEGRGIGIIDTSTVFHSLVDAESLLALTDAWTETESASFRNWMAEYLDWLLDSEKGQDEARESNNHGTWSDVQIAALAMYVGKTDLARDVAQAAKHVRVESQIEPDGAQPLELRRTRSMNYSLMNLNGMQCLALLAEHTGVDLWHFETEDGRGLRGALDWFVPYIRDGRDWPWDQITDFDPAGYIPLFRRGMVKYGDPAYREILAALPSDIVSGHRINLTFPSA